MTLTGTYLRTIDEKQRLAVPKRLRDVMIGESQNEFLFVAPETDRSLSLFSASAFDQRAHRLAAASANPADVHNYLRLYYSQAEQLQLDSQGRIRIPERLLQFANMTQEIVLLGVHDHVELWDKPTWDGFLSEHASEFDRMANEAFR